MGPYFSGIITVAVLGFLALLTWAAQREKPHADPAAGTLVFRHSAIFRWFSYVMAFGIPVAITVLVIFNPPKKDGDVGAIIGLYALFAGLSAPLLWESLRFSLTLSPEGVDCRSPWRSGRFLPWNEVKELSYSAVNSWFIIYATDGWKFRVSILVPGLAALLEEFERRLPLSALTPAKLGYDRVGRPFPEPNDKPAYQPHWERRNDSYR